MNRKDFLKRMLEGGIGACCCGAMLSRFSGEAWAGTPASQGAPDGQSWIPEMEKRMIRGAETPAWRRLDLAVDWIKHMMTNMDSILDPETKMALMQACGRSCYLRAFGVASDVKASPEAADQYIQALEGAGYKVERNAAGVLVHFSWGRNHQNPQGLIIQDGYCMCPIVEPILKGLSATYCNCSAGYVREFFERRVGRPVKVEVVETLQTGADDCRFNVEIPNLG